MKHPAEVTQLNVVARSPFHIYYEGPAQVVSARNKVGDFDILPGHADFFSILSPGTITIDVGAPGTEPVTFSINTGILTARDNQVLLFVNM